MSQLIGGRYAIVDGERVLIADQFDAPIAGAPPVAPAAEPSAEPGTTETDQPADTAVTEED